MAVSLNYFNFCFREIMPFAFHLVTNGSKSFDTHERPPRSQSELRQIQMLSLRLETKHSTVVAFTDDYMILFIIE